MLTLMVYLHGSEMTGRDNFQFKVDKSWGILDLNSTPIYDCHAMVEDSKGRLILLTNHQQNNIIIYNKKGELLNKWDTDMTDAHGMQIGTEENGNEYLILTDPGSHRVLKTDLNGNILMELGYPKESGQYADESNYKPTDAVIAPGGDFYITDGYGSSLITHYDKNGKWLKTFGKGQLKQPHGAVWDDRGPEPFLLVASRGNKEIVKYRPDGTLVKKIKTPGALVCMLRRYKDYMIVPCLNKFILILDKNNKVVANLSGMPVKYENGRLHTLRIEKKQRTFLGPHGICVAKDGTVYVPQWNSGTTFPLKLTPHGEHSAWK
jgi:sugar lactone lactonase YvrE